ncbi:MAG: hypothetical protein IPI63_03210 [Methanothrix sp.]|uniref:hypothetical protein n=1 Tax=Methanothrix sp. TaxID=90426 RepID=UPI0025CD45AD|nr:hypothetical protein [Methanothrix sp.]MBK7385772.1 hypothetical protein [Methanothrix sp.]
MKSQINDICPPTSIVSGLLISSRKAMQGTLRNHASSRPLAGAGQACLPPSSNCKSS